MSIEPCLKLTAIDGRGKKVKRQWVPDNCMELQWRSSAQSEHRSLQDAAQHCGVPAKATDCNISVSNELSVSHLRACPSPLGHWRRMTPADDGGGSQSHVHGVKGGTHNISSIGPAMSPSDSARWVSDVWNDLQQRCFYDLVGKSTALTIGCIRLFSARCARIRSITFEIKRRHVGDNSVVRSPGSSSGFFMTGVTMAVF